MTPRGIFLMEKNSKNSAIYSYCIKYQPGKEYNVCLITYHYWISIFSTFFYWTWKECSTSGIFNLTLLDWWVYEKWKVYEGKLLMIYPCNTFLLMSLSLMIDRQSLNMWSTRHLAIGVFLTENLTVFLK